MNEARLAEEEKGYGRRAALLGRGDQLVGRASGLADDATRSLQTVTGNIVDANTERMRNLEQVRALDDPLKEAALFRQAASGGVTDELNTELAAARGGLEIADRSGQGLDRATTMVNLSDSTGQKNLLNAQDAATQARAPMGQGFTAASGLTSTASSTTGSAGRTAGDLGNTYGARAAQLEQQRKAEEAARRSRTTQLITAATRAAAAYATGGMSELALAASGKSGLGPGSPRPATTSTSTATPSYFPSDVRMKENIEPVDDDAALEMVEDTDNYSWNYKGDPSQQQRVGPMAQDVNATMGEAAAPGGTQIDLVSMNGKMMGAVKALAKRTRKLEMAIEAGLDDVDDSAMSDVQWARVPDQHKAYPIAVF